MVRRREDDGGRRAAAAEGEENHYCQLRQAIEGGGEGVYSNIEPDQHQGDEGGGGRGHNMKILSALPPGCVLFVPRDAQMVGTQVLPCTIVPRDQVFKMIRANRNNQRRAQRRPEHAKDEEEVVVVEVVEEIGKDQAENYNVGGQAVEHQVKHQTKEKLESNGEEDKEDRLEESLQQQHAEEAGSIRGSHPEPSLPCDKSRSPSEDDENKESSEIKERSRDVETRERSKEIESEAREEVPGLIYIDYSQFDEDEESYGLGGSAYGLGGGLEDAYNLSQAGVTVDSSPIGMTDEKYKDALEEFIEKTSLEVTQPPQGADRRRRHRGSVRRQPSLLASLLPQALRPHRRQPRRRRQRRVEHEYEVIASPATKRTRSLLDQQLNHNIAIRD